MKKFFLLTLFCLLLSVSRSYAQVDVTASGGTTSGSYSTLKGAFDAINAGTHTGSIAISITSNTTETASCVVNASGSGSASYTSISISPSGGASVTITGSVGGDLIDLSGADNVKIDGLNTGGNALTIANSSMGTTSSAIRFINDAQSDTITNCTITSSHTSASYGTIVFATSAGGTGNDNNAITNCTIAETGTNLPAVGIYCSGTGTSGQENSGITISGCNIANYFNAGLVTNGILVSAGGTGWTISSNKFYQAATRTYTTGNIVNAISVITGNGHIISSNTIGYASSSATGTYTMAGTIAIRFVGINLSVGTVTTTSVQGNTIASISITTTSGAGTTNGVLCGINVTGGNVNIGTTSGNTIGVSSGTGSLSATPSTTGGSVVGINTSSTGTIVIQNNTIGGLSAVGSTASIGSAVHGIYVGGVATSLTISGNTIGNATANNMVAGASGTTTGATLVSGIASISTSTTLTFSGNTIQNLTSYGTSTSSYVRGIQTTTSGTTTAATISNNTIKNLNTNGALTGYSSGQTCATGIHFAAGLNAAISGNTIFNINCNNSTATTNVVCAGIAMASATSTRTFNNVIYGLSNAGTGTTATTPPVIAGILVRSGTTSDTIYNNMISLGNGQSTNTAIIGIMCNHGSTPDPANAIYFNTINIEGTVTSGALSTFAFLRGDLTTAAKTAPVDLRNNILINNRTGGTGGHYAISNGFGTATPSATGWSTNASNNNVLNSANSSTIGHWTAAKDFSSWKSTSASDASSISGVTVTFVNSANNLHLNLGTSVTALESGGVAITGYSSDIDGHTRPGPAGSSNGGGTSPDLGADEFDGVPGDVFAPVINYTALSNTSSTSNRTTSSFATITDGGSGVNTTSGTRPRLYYKKSSDNNTFGANTSGTNGWKWVQANGTTSPFDFTIDYSLINGGSVSTSDVIQYFVVAQDQASTPNIAASPSSGFSGTSVSSISSAPTTPNSYTIVSPLSTSINVGTGQTYTSLTGAGGLFAAINNSVLSGNTTVTVVSDLSEDGTNALNNPGLGGYTLTIVPDGTTIRVISNSTTLAQAMIRLDGATNVTFDGRFSGSGQYLRIVNTHTTAASCYPAIQVLNGATGNTIRNCILETNTSSTSQATVVMGTGTNSLTLKANDLRDAVGTPGTAGVPYAAVYSNNVANTITIGGSTASDGNNIYNFTNNGINLTNVANGVTIQYNNFYQTAARSTALSCIYIATGSTHTVSNNNIYQTAGVNTSSFYGIQVIGAGNGHTINNNSIGGSNASRGGAALTTNAASAFNGIYLTAGTSSYSNIQGNTFSNFGNIYTSTSGSVFAIQVTAGNVNIGTTTGNTIGGLASASDTVQNAYDNSMIYYTGTGTVDIENNLVANVTYYRNSNDRTAGIGIGGACTAIIKNNTIRDIRSNSTGTTTTSFACWGIYIASTLSATSNIEGNTIYNIENTNTGGTACLAAGIRITSAPTAGATIQRNKIYNIKAQGIGTGTSGPDVAGISITTGANAITISNNQITVGGGCSADTRAMGIYDASTAAHNYYYNSIYVTGTMSSGTNNSYCVYRGATSGSTNMRNNLLYNDRSGSTGGMYAVGSSSAILGASNLNYNLAVVPDTAKLVEMPTGTANGWAAIGTLFTTTPNSNVVEPTTNVSAANLFNNSSSYDLNIKTNNVACWYANGRGLQISGQTADYGSAGAARSTTIAGGGTDIGADEFTPSVNPPDVTVSGSHSTSGTEVFTFAGRTVASITWGSGGTLPTLSSYKYWPGSWPNDLTNNGTATGATYTNAYWVINVSGGSGYTYDITLYYDDALLGTIATEANMVVAKKATGTAGTWGLQSTTINTTTNTLTVTGLSSFSEFAGSENATPLPVEWLSFSGKNVFENVVLNWTTASEKSNKEFIVERSSDMLNFETAGVVKSKGNSNTPTGYTFTDVKPFTGSTTLYYRLKQVDFNGESDYSSVVSVSTGKNGVTIETINPNPFTQQLNVTLDNVSEGNVAIAVYDMSGKVLYTHSQNTRSGKLVIDLKDLSNLTEGVYLLSITNGSETIRQKLVKVQ